MLKEVTDASEPVGELLESEPDPEPEPELESDVSEGPVSAGLLDFVDVGNSGGLETEGELGDWLGEAEPEKELKKLGDIEVDKVDSLRRIEMLEKLVVKESKLVADLTELVGEFEIDSVKSLEEFAELGITEDDTKESVGDSLKLGRSKVDAAKSLEKSMKLIRELEIDIEKSLE